MKRIVCFILTAFVLLSCKTVDGNKTKNEVNVIYVNQVGYLPDSEKYFLTESSAEVFNIVDESGNSVFSGEMKLWRKDDPSSGMTLNIGYFTDLKIKGKYTVELDKGSKSFPFEIREDIFNSIRNDSIKSFYLQRSGMELLKEHVGDFKRKAGHTSELKYHSSSPIKGKKDVSGGWYDAGDFGRYITPGSVAVSLMMMGYEQYPEKFNFDDNNILESGNGISDFIDEIRYELEWMLKMQHLEDDEFKGALPYMLNSRNYVWEMPHVGSQSQKIYDFSSVATADFAAVMAQSARLFKSFDEEFALECLNASKLAWKFVTNNDEYPKGGFRRPMDTQTGGYATNASDNLVIIDDMTWAAVELFLTTGEDEYHDFVKESFSGISDFSGGMSWIDTMGFAKMQYVLGKHEKIDTELQNKMFNLFLEHCNDLLDTVNNDGFKATLGVDDYVWGSNGDLLTRGEYLIFAHLKTGDIKFYNGALAQLNYVLGMNGNNMSYVTNSGTVYPHKIHHAIMDSDGISASFPGLVAGGPNSRLYGDNTLPMYFNGNTPPGLCYIDHIDSWASNENCITYNAPLIPVSAYFSN